MSFIQGVIELKKSRVSVNFRELTPRNVAPDSRSGVPAPDIDLMRQSIARQPSTADRLLQSKGHARRPAAHSPINKKTGDLCGSPVKYLTIHVKSLKRFDLL
jgi:hypothetical protein